MIHLVRFAIATLIPLAGALAASPATQPARQPAGTAAWKPLSEYPRPPAPDTGWGIHDNPNCYWKAADLDAFFKELKTRYGFSWFKVLACGSNKLDVVAAAHRQGVEPVVRLYVSRPSPYYPKAGREEKEFREQVRAYVTAGARYFEAGNEPNLSGEWAEGEWNKPHRTERLCRQWLRARRLIAREGGIPVFYAMTPGGEDGRSAGAWWKDCFETFQRMNRIEEAFAGCAFGAHLGTLNHPVDYPFDPQKNLPHATPAERIASLKKDNTCYLGVELLIHLMDEYLPQRIPILSTEGGTFVDNDADKGYPKVTAEMHRDMNLEIFRRFNPKNPHYWGDPLFAQMSWIYHADGPGGFGLDSWFDNPKYGRMPILDALEKEPRFNRHP